MSDTKIDSRAKVLIAEDDTIVALDLQGMITRLGYDVVQIANTPQSATASVTRFSPDIMLIDLGFPGEPDAVSLARQIHETLDIPVVFCVGTPDMASLARTKGLDYATYLLKPINPDSLSTAIDTMLYKYKLERRVRQAEDKFRQLADTCELLRFFLDRDAATGWEWSAESGLEADADTLQDALRDRLAACIAKSAAGGVPERINILLPGPEGGWAVLGIRSAGRNGLHGLLVPLLRAPE